jgi:hypothetical protein
VSAERRSRYLRVVRPGSGAGSEAAATPPLPVEPPLTPPLWLDAPRAVAHKLGATHPQGGPVGATFTSDEADEDPLGAALRDRLHQAVGEVRPAPDSLNRLRRAVPQRRTLRRRAYGGAAVAASLALVGLTALHSLGPDGSASAETGPAGQLLPGAHPSTTGNGLGGTATGTAVPGGATADSSTYATHSHQPGTVLVPLPSGGVTTLPAGATHSAASAALAECTRGQLGNGAAGVAPADSSGIVYGSFAISNVSTAPCKISSSGAIDVLSPVGTQTSRFAVAPHTAGDPAVALPSPDPSHPSVELGPGQTYVVDFAFVPGGTCASGSSAGPTGTASPTATTPGTTSSGTTGNTSGTTAAANGSSGGTADSPTASAGTPGGTSGSGGTGGSGGTATPGAPSVQVASVPASGGKAAATTTLQGACSGTIYRTDPLPAPH